MKEVLLVRTQRKRKEGKRESGVLASQRENNTKMRRRKERRNG